VATITTINSAGGGTVTLTPGCTYVLTTNHSRGTARTACRSSPPPSPSRATPTPSLAAGGAPAFRIVEVTGTGSLTLKSVTLTPRSTVPTGLSPELAR
jgi:hypothetical protein